MDETEAWPEEAIKRLAKAVRDRRDELNVTQTEVSAKGGPSPATLSLIESAARSSFSRTTLRKLERGLGWAGGEAMRIVRGENASATGGDTPTPRRVPIETGRPDVHAVVETFAAWDAPPKDKLQVLQKLLEQAIKEMPNGS
ncbi:helix-turn-helix transcriptional regulator [Nonomuraea sp. NPDC049758]|uniref:helix-turn-helix domain-containing protein n=1 Tax=Nonomuraea sp. NPDC049758 TaxID=3154360 RepID=UPI00343C2779